MKKLLGIVVLGLFLITPSQADDIRDLQIERMSIGDSLLDYFSENEIKSGITEYHYKDDTFYEVEFYNHKSFNTYENIQVGLKKNDNYYIIEKILGFNYVKTNIIEDCLNKVDTVSKEILNILPNTETVYEDKNHAGDPSGESKTKVAYIIHDTGEIWIECYDWSETITKKKRWVDNFGVSLISKEYSIWIKTNAY